MKRILLAALFVGLAAPAFAVCPSPLTGKDASGTTQNFGVTVDANGYCYGNVAIVDGSAAANKAAINGSGQIGIQPPPSLPLPSGAATAAKQPALGTAGAPSADVLSVQGAASMTPLSVLPAASSASSAGIAPVVSGAATASQVLKNASGNLYGVYAVNLTSTPGFLLLLNATSAPADGAVTPLGCVPLAAAGGAPAVLNYSGGPPAYYSAGIVAVVSSASTCFTKTTGTIAAFISGAVQ